jgi:hypothetical protein
MRIQLEVILDLKEARRGLVPFSGCTHIIIRRGETLEWVIEHGALVPC